MSQHHLSHEWTPQGKQRFLSVFKYRHKERNWVEEIRLAHSIPLSCEKCFLLWMEFFLITFYFFFSRTCEHSLLLNIPPYPPLSYCVMFSFTSNMKFEGISAPFLTQSDTKHDGILAWRIFRRRHLTDFSFSCRESRLFGITREHVQGKGRR